MKKVSLLIFALILLLVFVACQPTEEACAHEWTAATCTAAKTCTKCNATEGAALGHDWAAATCTAAKTCKNCNETEGTPLGHTEVTLEAKDATCTATGLTEGKKCSVCNTVTKAQTTVPATGHDLVQHEAKEATCTEGGWNAYETCNKCDHNTKVEVGAHGHTEQTLEAVDPTCTETGLTAGKKCTVCGTTTVAQEEVPATGHNSDVNVPGTAATCGETGLTDGKKCSVCGTTTVEQTVIPATGEHSNLWGEEEGTRQEPTCTEDGYVEYVVLCDVCGAVMSSRTETLEAPGHNVPDATYNNDATCVADGTKTGTCTICNESVTATAEGTALGHKMPTDAVCGEMWTCENGCGVPQGPREHTMASATCTTPSTCTNCGHTDGDVLPHTPGEAHEENVVASGCETSGSYDLVTRCTVCNAVTNSEPKTTAPTGHKMSAATCDAPSTCENGCGKTEGEKVANHTPTASVANGVITYTCTTCSDAFVADESLIYTDEKDLYFTKNGDAALSKADGTYVVSATGSAKAQYMIYGPSNSKGHADSLKKWGEGAFGVFAFDLKAGTITEELRVIVMSARDNANWDKNGGWNGNSVDVLAVKPNGSGNFDIYGKSVTSNVFATVSGDEWVRVEMFIQMANNGLKISYYINGQFCNTYESAFPIAGQSIQNLDINCFYMCGYTDAGTGFALDNIYFGAQQQSEWLFDEHKHVWAEADCENAKHCTACGLVYEGSTALGHTEATRNVNVVAPDCVNGGSHDVETYCTTCGKVSGTEHVVDEATGHDLDENNVCKVCGTDLHECNLVASETVAPTCTEGGYTVYRCDHANCTMHENRDFTEATGHSMQAATCTAPATCSKCGHTEGDAKGHNYAAPTCAVASKCTVCGDVKGTPNADAHNLTSTYANNTLTYSCSVCNYKFVVDTFDYSDGTNYNGMHANASQNNTVYTTNPDKANYPVMKDGYLEFIRTDAEAGAQKQLQMWLPSANGGTNKFSGFTAASNSIGYFAFKVDAKTDVNFEMKLVDHRVDSLNGTSIRWGDQWAINDPVFRVMPAEGGKTELRGFNSVSLGKFDVDENGFTGWVDVAIQIVLDPATDKVIAHYYINGAYVATSSRDLTTHTDAIQGVYLNFNSKAAGCGYRIDNLTFGYSAHKHDLVPTVENGVLSYNCSCGTEFLASSEVLEWNGDGSDNGLRNVPNGNVELTVNSQGQYEYIFKPETDVAPDFSAAGNQSADGWFEYDGKGYAGGQLQMWMPSNNRGESTLTGFSCENDAVGVISFNVKTNMQRHPDWDTSLTFSVGKPRNASDWSSSGGWDTSSINIFTIEEYQASGIVVKGGLNGTNLNLGTIPVTEDGWSEWFNVMIVIEMTKEEYINVYYYINGALCGTDSRDLNNPSGYRTLNPKMIEALQISGWTYAPNTGIVFDDFYFGYTANGHNTLDGHVHNLTETTCGEKSTCSCGWTGYTVAHTFATACAPACDVCGLANQNPANHANLTPTVENGVVKYSCSACNYHYVTDAHSLYYDGSEKIGAWSANNEIAIKVEDGYNRVYMTESDGTYHGALGNQHMLWVPSGSTPAEFDNFTCAQNATGFISFKMKGYSDTNNIECKINDARGTNAFNWSTTSVSIFSIAPVKEGETVAKILGLNGQQITTVPVGEDHWTNWLDVVIMIQLSDDNMISVDYYINGEYITNIHVAMPINTYKISTFYINGYVKDQNGGYCLDDMAFGYTTNGAKKTVPSDPLFNEDGSLKVEEIGNRNATTDNTANVTATALLSIVDGKIKQFDQTNKAPEGDHTYGYFVKEVGTSHYVKAYKDGGYVEAVYLSRSVDWDTYASVSTQNQFKSEFRFNIDNSKRVTSISFDYLLNGTLTPNRDSKAKDQLSIFQIKYTNKADNTYDPNDQYFNVIVDMFGGENNFLVADSEWHTFSYTFENSVQLDNFLIILSEFQGELLIANLVVTYE